MNPVGVTLTPLKLPSKGPKELLDVIDILTATPFTERVIQTFVPCGITSTPREPAEGEPLTTRLI